MVPKTYSMIFRIFLSDKFFLHSSTVDSDHWRCAQISDSWQEHSIVTIYFGFSATTS